MLRAPILWITERPAVRRLAVERSLGRAVASRFVAGDTLDQGVDVARGLSSLGIATMLDHLGENVDSPPAASGAADAYALALKRLADEPDLGANISVKLTQLGLDFSTELCAENLERVLEAASHPEMPTLVMIDMEAREYVDRTLDIYLNMRRDHPNVGLCLQAYLRRTASDAARIAGPEAIVRVAKGAYLEPPEVAFPTRVEVSRNYATVAVALLRAGSTVHFATHDQSLVRGARRFVHDQAIPPARYEFQMLHGVRRDLRASLVAEGEPVRVYVPYGTQWYPYLTRRLAERPANLWFFASNLLRWRG